MKAKYKHDGNDCLIYDQVICVDNIFVTARIYQGLFETEPKITTKVCLTNAEARRMFYNTCIKLEKDGCDCIYREV